MLRATYTITARIMGERIVSDLTSRDEDNQRPSGPNPAEGGRARAEKLSHKERSEIARLAAEARWRQGVIRATHAGELKIGEITIPCAVLEDGTRVLTQEGFYKAIGRSGKPAAGRGSQVEKVAPFLDLDNLKPFVSEELANSTKPFVFQVPKGSRAYGYRAELLPQVCEVYLKARDANELLKSQERFAAACDILMRGLAHVGIVALIDEATGYQSDRARDALAKILEAFVAKELQKWVKTFPAAFYREMFRLRGIPYNGQVKRPGYIGHITNDLVYARLAPGVLKELREKNPTNEKGHRRNKHHQWLTENIGHPKLVSHLDSVISLMKAADEWEQFKCMIDRAKPRMIELPLFDGLEDE
jgi:P63C domain